MLIFVGIKRYWNMKRKIFTLLLIAGMMLALPSQVQANSAIEILEEQDFNDVTISLSESTLHVTGAGGQVLYIYNVAGICVKTFRVDSNDKRYDLNLPKGCYIIKVGKTVRKVSIR